MHQSLIIFLIQFSITIVFHKSSLKDFLYCKFQKYFWRLSISSLVTAPPTPPLGGSVSGVLPREDADGNRRIKLAIKRRQSIPKNIPNEPNISHIFPKRYSQPMIERMRNLLKFPQLLLNRIWNYTIVIHSEEDAKNKTVHLYFIPWK